MKNSFKTLLGGALLVALPMFLTSCEDILGEWDKPTPVTPGGGSGEGGGTGEGGEGGSGTTPSATKTAGSISYASATLTRGTKDPAFTFELSKTGDGTVTYSSSNTAVADVDVNTGEITTKGVVGTTTITATVADSEGYTYATNTASYDLTLADGISYLDTNAGTIKYIGVGGATDYTVLTDGMNYLTGTYLVKETVNISSSVNLTDNVTILLCDGADLNISGVIHGSPTYNLTIYSQSDGNNKGKLSVTGNNSPAIQVNYLKIYGGEITATAEGTDHHGIHVKNTLEIFGGDVKAQGCAGGHGVYCESTSESNSLYVLKNGKLEAIGGNSTTSNGGDGVKCKTDGTGNAFVSGNAVLIAKGGDGEGYSGGFGVNAWPCTSGNCEFTATGGNSSNTTAGYGVNKLQYEGGKVTIMAGTGTSGGAVYNSTFGSSMNTVFEQTTNGTDWTDFNVIYGDNSSLGKLGIRKIN